LQFIFFNLSICSLHVGFDSVSSETTESKKKKIYFRIDNEVRSEGAHPLDRALS